MGTHYPQLTTFTRDPVRIAKRLEDERKKPKWLERWGVLLESLAQTRIEALRAGAAAQTPDEEEFVELIRLSEKRKLW